MINVFQPTLGKEELDRIAQVFQSNWIGKGKLVAEFEKLYAEHLGSSVDRVLSTNCCSEGLFSSMHLLDIQPGDEVILTTIRLVTNKRKRRPLWLCRGLRRNWRSRNL